MSDTIRLRLLRLQRILVEQPFRYTMQRLCDTLSVSRSTIMHDIEAFRNAGYVVEVDDSYRWGFVVNQPMKELKDLLHFSEEDQIVLSRAIDQVTAYSKRGERLKKKLASVYDFGKLGHSYLRKPYLSKLEILLKAKEEKRIVVLQNYRSSNSNKIEDRIVEVFHISPADDMLHAVDLEVEEIRLFRISRIGFVKEYDDFWTHTHLHHVRATDPFRIVSDEHDIIHVRMEVGAYNELIDRFPLTIRYIEQYGEREFDLQCPVNADYKGLTNFLLGHHNQIIDIVGSDKLRNHITAELKKIQSNWEL